MKEQLRREFAKLDIGVRDSSGDYSAQITDRHLLAALIELLPEPEFETWTDYYYVDVDGVEVEIEAAASQFSVEEGGVDFYFSIDASAHLDDELLDKLFEKYARKAEIYVDWTEEFTRIPDGQLDELQRMGFPVEGLPRSLSFRVISAFFG